MPPKKAQKTSPLQAVAAYDLRKVWVPYVAPDGSSSYAPRKMKAKAALLRERLLTRARQKKETTKSSTRSTTHDTSNPAPSKPTMAAKQCKLAKPSAKKATPKPVSAPPPSLLKPVLASRSSVAAPNQLKKRKAVGIVGPIEELAHEMREEEVETEEEGGQQEEEEGDDDTEEDELSSTLNLLKASKQFKDHVF